MNKKFMGLAVLLLMLLAWVSFPVPATASPAVIYVDADASRANDGTSWTDAHNDLQDALVDAQAGDQIWVAAGIC